MTVQRGGPPSADEEVGKAAQMAVPCPEQNASPRRVLVEVDVRCGEHFVVMVDLEIDELCRSAHEHGDRRSA